MVSRLSPEWSARLQWIQIPWVSPGCRALRGFVPSWWTWIPSMPLLRWRSPPLCFSRRCAKHNVSNSQPKNFVSEDIGGHVGSDRLNSLVKLLRIRGDGLELHHQLVWKFIFCILLKSSLIWFHTYQTHPQSTACLSKECVGRMSRSIPSQSQRFCSHSFGTPLKPTWSPLILTRML